MEDPVAYLWAFPREDFELWRCLEGDPRGIETFEDYAAHLVARHRDLESRGKTVVFVRLRAAEMISQLAHRGLSYSWAARAFVLQAARDEFKHLQPRQCDRRKFVGQ